jgi:hypothetical protein
MDGIARSMPATAPPEAIMPAPESGAKDDATGAIVATPTTPAMQWEAMREPVLRGLAQLIDGFDSSDAAAGMAWVYLPAFVQGRTLARRETVNFVDEYDMPFGAPPLRYQGTLRLERIDRAANTAVVVRRATLDQASAREALRSVTEFVSDALVEPLAPQLREGEQPPDGAAFAQVLDSMLADLNYEETTRGVIDLSTGMARETTTEYTLSARMAGSEEAVETRGRIVTRVTAGAPDVPRLPRN